MPPVMCCYNRKDNLFNGYSKSVEITTEKDSVMSLYKVYIESLLSLYRFGIDFVASMYGIYSESVIGI